MRKTFLRPALFITALLISTEVLLLLIASIKPRIEHSSPEEAAIRNLRTVNVAQARYLELYGKYAASLQDLGDLIPADLASGKKSGYKFQMTGSDRHYVITALPGETMARRSFYSDEAMSFEKAPARSPPDHTAGLA